MHIIALTDSPFVACRSSVQRIEGAGEGGSNPQGYPCRGIGGKAQGAAQPLPEGRERKEQINPKRGNPDTRWVSSYGLKHRWSKLPLSGRNHPRWRPALFAHAPLVPT